MGSGSHKAYLGPNDQIDIILGVTDDNKCDSFSPYLTDKCQKISI